MEAKVYQNAPAMSKAPNPRGLVTPVQFLKGVGPERARLLERLALFTIEDLLYHFPRRYEHRLPVRPVSQAVVGEKQCLAGTIQSRGLIRRKGARSLFRATISDGKKTIYATFFNMPYLLKTFTVRASIVLYGAVELEGRNLKMIHPEFEITAPDAEGAPSAHFGRITPVYPLTEELSQKGLRSLLFRTTAEYAPRAIEEWPPSLRGDLKMMSKGQALSQIHFPQTISHLKSAYERLVFDEFLMMQLVIQMKKKELLRESREFAHQGGEERVEQLKKSLPFELTAGQAAAIADILTDMRKDRAMNRLVQGDVGSGKTVVAAAAIAFTSANGFQAALMAPTEVLAQQHYAGLSRLLEPLGIDCAYLGQGLPAEEKKSVLLRAASGEIKVLIGTHALLEEGVKFFRLGLTVIDEQHKFGVFQRTALKNKNALTHFLLMTATPIPRTLAMTLYGDLDVSSINELPKGRQPIRTIWVSDQRRPEIYDFTRSQIESGRQAYVICPLIDENSENELKSAESVYKNLSTQFPSASVGLLHGRMKANEKKRVMTAFKEARIQILVSTVVIEVGVDVPNATVLIIENAERFGLAQLHQLRGRVGRGEYESSCILFSQAENPDSVERLRAFERTASGFEIAEEDLRLRGGGDLAGEKQHGLPPLRIGDIVKDARLLMLARKKAVELVSVDPKLLKAEHRFLRYAVYHRHREFLERGAGGS